MCSASLSACTPLSPICATVWWKVSSCHALQHMLLTAKPQPCECAVFLEHFAQCLCPSVAQLVPCLLGWFCSGGSCCHTLHSQLRSTFTRVVLLQSSLLSVCTSSTPIWFPVPLLSCGGVALALFCCDSLPRFSFASPLFVCSAWMIALAPSAPIWLPVCLVLVCGTSCLSPQSHHTLQVKRSQGGVGLQCFPQLARSLLSCLGCWYSVQFAVSQCCLLCSHLRASALPVHS